jgi:ABC-type sugar transport system ATPase subunit
MTDGAQSLTGGDVARLRVAGLTKRYGSQTALAAVDLRVAPGEVVAVVGENGAGKSTLSKILAGAIRPDAGRVEVDGRSVEFSSPRDSIRHGISYIPQELAYLPNLGVADNLLVGRWPSRFGFTNRAVVRREAAALAERFGIDIDVDEPIANLRLAERQLAEILKALARDTRVLILDEPTASLTSSEAQNLFRVLRGLAESGVGAIFISHRIDEVFDIADRIVVLRNGRVAASLDPRRTTPRELITHMLGSEVAAMERAVEAASAPPTDDTALRIVSWSRAGLPPIRDLSFDLQRGEILGLFGQRGAGADLVADGLGGRIGDFRGSVERNGVRRSTFSNPRDSRSAGIAYVPPERKRDGLVLGMSIAANLSLLTLRRISRFGWINNYRERRDARGWRERLQIRSRSVTQNVGSLSGGNQQKVLLGARLAAQPEILVLNEPTRGVDVGSRAEIHRYLRDEATRGTAVLWVTSDVEEVVTVSDRVIVMRDGVAVAELSGDDITQQNALALATKEVEVPA